MSLIINMLKDLEKREKKISPVTYTTLTTETHSRKKHALKKIGLIIAIFILLITFISFIFTTKNTIQPPPIATIPVKSTPIITPITQETDWLKPVSINGITVQLKENITELSFFLTHPALYRLVSDGIHNQLLVIIDQGELQSQLPSVQYLNNAIQNIAVKKVEEGTEFILTLSPNAILKYVNLNTDKNNPELIIAIASETTNNPFNSNTPAQIIKTPALQSVLLKQYETALISAEQGQYQTAINTLSSLLKMDPNYKDARVSLAALLMDQGALTTANRLIATGLQLAPNYLPFIELKARILANRGKTQDAITLLQSVSPELVDNPDYHAFIAALYARNNNNETAMKIYKKLISINPHNGNWWFGLGVSLDKLGHSHDALNAYTQAMTQGHLNTVSIDYLQKRVKILEKAE